MLSTMQIMVERVADLIEVRVMAERLIEFHLGRNSDSWVFRFDNAKKRGGLCNHSTRTISMSKYLCAVWTPEECEQVMLHEIAHALAPKHDRHSREWRAIATSIGFTGKVTHSNAVALDRAPWRGLCPAGHEYHRFRRPYHRKESCPKCHRGYSEAHRIVWEFRS